MSQRRIFLLDIARSICIILVVIGHFYPDNATPEYKIFRQWIYAFHMPVFLFISGFLFLKFHDFSSSFTAFIKKKFNRLIIPYLVTSIIVISLKLVAQKGGDLDNPVTVLSYLKILWQPEAGFFLWFIWTLFTIFLIVPWIKTQRSRVFLVIIAFLLHYLFLANEFLTSNNGLLPEVFSLNQTMRMIWWFVLGMLCVDLRWDLYFTDKSKYILLSAFFCVSIWFCLDPSYDEKSLPAAILPYLGIISVLIVSDSVDRNCVEHYIIPFSKATFFIYLFHTTFMGFAKSVCDKFIYFHSISGFYTEAVLVTLVGVFLPYAAYTFLTHRLPSLKKYI